MDLCQATTDSGIVTGRHLDDGPRRRQLTSETVRWQTVLSLARRLVRLVSCATAAPAMPAGGGSKSAALLAGREEAFKERAHKERSTVELRNGGGGVAHSLSTPGTNTAPAPKIGTPLEEKQAGNALFAGKEFAAAAKRYSQAIVQLDGEMRCGVWVPASAANKDGDSADILKVCQLNRAACLLHLGDMAGCVRDCSSVLALEPLNVKALFRRAKAGSNMRTDILSVSNAKSDLHMAQLLAPNDRQIAALKAQIEADLPGLEDRLLALHYRDQAFWNVGDTVMVTKKATQKLGGRGSLRPGDVGVIRDVDQELKAGGRVQVQNLKTSECYWYDMEEIGRAYHGAEEVDAGAEPTAPAAAHAHAAAVAAVAGGPEPEAVAEAHSADLQRLEQLETDMRAARAPVAAGPEEEEEEESPAIGSGETDADAERDIDEILAAMAEELGGDLSGLDGVSPPTRGGNPEEEDAGDPITVAELELQS